MCILIGVYKCGVHFMFRVCVQHSINTCRWLVILIYIILWDSLDDKLTPHVLSEWMVEVCRFDIWVIDSELV